MMFCLYLVGSLFRSITTPGSTRGDARLRPGSISFYNHGQKSWDKFTFVALFHTRQTNSQARIHLHMFSSSPPPPPSAMLDTCTRYFSRCSTLYAGGGGGEGGGSNAFCNGKQCFFKNSVLNTQKINAVTQVSQGILSTIV